jgi:spore germination cell wall hydrolase CwlJ-like protein
MLAWQKRRLHSPAVKFPAPFRPARACEASKPHPAARLLLADRECKSAAAGIAALFIAILLLGHSAGPTKSPIAGRGILSSDAAASTIREGARPRVAPAVWAAAAQQAAPFIAPTVITRAAPFLYKGSRDNRDYALDCLAAAAWYEAGNDPAGQRSVVQVVLNRVRHPSFPSTVCGVVFQGSERSTGCQFTFTCDGSMQRRSPSGWEWKRARRLSEEALDGEVDASVGQATHYHADYVSPWWSSALQRVNQIGAHIFYRWPGGRGKLAGTRNVGTEAAAFKALEQARSAPHVATETEEPAVAALPGPEAAPPTSPNVSRAELVGVDPQSPSGRWAVTALSRCAGRTACTVVGYAQGDELARNMNLEPARMERPLFLFVRDDTSAMELALWDCGRTVRASTSQCLPDDRQALLHLMRNR